MLVKLFSQALCMFVTNNAPHTSAACASAHNRRQQPLSGLTVSLPGLNKAVWQL